MMPHHLTRMYEQRPCGADSQSANEGNGNTGPTWRRPVAIVLSCTTVLLLLLTAVGSQHSDNGGGEFTGWRRSFRLTAARWTEVLPIRCDSALGFVVFQDHVCIDSLRLHPHERLASHTTAWLHVWDGFEQQMRMQPLRVAAQPA